MVIAKHCGPLLGCKGTTEFIYSHFLCQFSSFLLKNCDWIFKSWGLKKKKKKVLVHFLPFLKKKNHKLMFVKSKCWEILEIKQFMAGQPQ